MSSNAQQVMGHALRPKISQFNSSSQSFSKFQNELQNSFVSGHPNPMDPKKSAGSFCDLLESIDTAEKALGALRKSRDVVDVEPAKADVAFLKASLLSWEKDDLTFLSILQHALGGPAYLIAFPPVSTFKLKEKPELPGALAYDRLQKEYSQAPVNIFDKYSSEQSLNEFFVQPNLASPQIEVFLSEKISAHIAKYSCDEHVSNDLYFKFSNVFLQHLPDGPSYMALHVKCRTDFNEEDNKENGKDLFIKTVKEAQAIFKAIQEIQHQAVALKTSAKIRVVPNREANVVPNLTKSKVKQQQQSIKPSANLQSANGKHLKLCYFFNTDNGCRWGSACEFKHDPKATRQDLDKQRASDRMAYVGAVASFANVDKKSIAPSSSSNKSAEFYCSFSVSPDLLLNESYLDTGASNTMSPHKHLFTDLAKSRIEIHVANDSIIYSAMVGVFHLKTKLSDGTSITLHLKNSLFVPSLCATLISDRSLTHLKYAILIEENGASLMKGAQQIDLQRNGSGIISFPTPINAFVVSSSSKCDVSSITPVLNQNSSIADGSLHVSSTPIVEIVSDPIVNDIVSSNKSGLKTLSMSDLHAQHSSFGHINNLYLAVSRIFYNNQTKKIFLL